MDTDNRPAGVAWGHVRPASPTARVPHRKRLVFHVPSALEAHSGARLLRAIREQFASDGPVLRAYRFPGTSGHRVGVVERGRGWIAYQGRRTTLEPGTLYVLFDGVPVSLGPDPSEPMEVTFVLLAGEAIDTLLQSVGLTPARPTLEAGPCPEFRTIYRELRDGRGAYVLRAQAALWSLFGRIVEAAHGSAGRPPALAGEVDLASGRAAALAMTAGVPASRAQADGAVERATVMARLHLDEPDLRLADLARVACLGRSQFSARFTRVMGCTPMQYIERLRLTEARALLADEDLPVGEVAQRCGFKDPAYFGRRFRRATGHAPAAFRALARQRAAAG